jgi:hypothetical protein
VTDLIEAVALGIEDGLADVLGLVAYQGDRRREDREPGAMESQDHHERNTPPVPSQRHEEILPEEAGITGRGLRYTPSAHLGTDTVE